MLSFEEKFDIIIMFKKGLPLNVKLPYSKTTKPSLQTRRAAALMGKSQGLFVAQNETSSPIEINTIVKTENDNLLIKDVDGKGNDLSIKYEDIISTKLKKHKLIVKLNNNLIFEFKFSFLARIGVKKTGFNSEQILEVFNDYLLEDYKHY